MSMKFLFLPMTLLFSFHLLCSDEHSKLLENCQILMPEHNKCYSLSWSDGPFLGEYSTALLHLYDLKSGEKVSPLKYDSKVKAWMYMSSGHNHGSRPIVHKLLDDQSLELSQIYFMGGMRGYWTLKLRSQLLDDEVILFTSDF